MTCISKIAYLAKSKVRLPIPGWKPTSDLKFPNGIAMRTPGVPCPGHNIGKYTLCFVKYMNNILYFKKGAFQSLIHISCCITCSGHVQGQLLSCSQLDSMLIPSFAQDNS